MPSSRESVPDPASEKFTRGERLRKRSEFDRVYQDGSKVGGKLCVLCYIQNSLGWSRLGLTVSRRIGPAVTRNLVKRRYREIFRLNKPLVPVPLDIVINAKTVIGTSSYQDLEAEYRWMLNKIARALKRPS